MRFKVLVPLLVAALAAVPAADAKKPPKHTAAQAKKAVIAEIEARYFVYNHTIADPGTVKNSASCSALNNNLFKCSWEATESSFSTDTFGKARVKFYAKGYEVTFADVTCYDDNPVSMCDEDPHNG